MALLIGLITIIFLAGCEDTTQESASYSHDLQPLFNTQCLDCHGQAGSANLDLSSYETLMSAESDNAPVVVAYQAEASLLWEKVALQSPSIGQRMPLGRNPLSQTEISLIEDWINEGAKDN